jgi:serine protease
LTAGQSINLFIAEDPNIADLDLYLYDENEFLVDSAIGTGSQESLVVPAAGGFFVEVRAERSASNYNLTIGQATLSLTADELRLSDTFVAGEIIMRFKHNRFSAQSARSLKSQGIIAGMQAHAGSPEREMLMRFDGEPGRQQALSALRQLQGKSNLADHRPIDPELQRKLDTLRIIKSLRRRADVQYAHPNYIHRPLLVPNDPLYPRQWHHPQISLPQTWDVTTGSTDVVVAVIDTGVLVNHPDLANRLTADGYDFVSNPSRAQDGDGIDADPADPGDGINGGSSYHGTHVAGIIAAETDNNLGVAGTAWQTKIMPVRALGLGGGTEYDILQAVRYAAGLENDAETVPIQHADIINLSLGGGSFNPAAQDVYTQARDRGVVIVAAAGNTPTGAPVYPAAYDGVVSVSAVDINKEAAPYANFGPTVDVAAPGGNTNADINLDGFPDGVLSTCGTGRGGIIEFGYCFLAGTSMAAAGMSGVVALMKAVYPDLSPPELDVLLNSGLITDDLGPAGRDDQFGNGLINAFDAIAEAQSLENGGTLPLTLIVNPSFLNFGPTSAATLSVQQAGGAAGDTLFVQSVIADVAWLEITADKVDINHVGSYRITVDRRQLSTIPGVYSATIVVDALDPAVNDIEVPVSVQVVTPIMGGNTGFHFVLLIDAQTGIAIAQDAVPFDTGGYSYAFTGIPRGTYQIFAGTDLNNNFLIGDAGEAFGAYLTLDQPTNVKLSEDTIDLNFNTNFIVTISSQQTNTRPTGKRLLERLRPERRSK